MIHFWAESRSYFLANEKKFVRLCVSKEMFLDTFHRVLEVLNHETVLGAFTRLVPTLEKILVIAKLKLYH